MFLHRMMMVMNLKKDFGSLLTSALDLPGETMERLPMGTFRGKEEISLENHRGILSYEKEEIRIAVKRGAVVIRGRDLVISIMSKTRLQIRGTITIIELE